MQQNNKRIIMICGLQYDYVDLVTLSVIIVTLILMI